MAITVDNVTENPDHGPTGDYTFNHVTGALSKGYVIVGVWINGAIRIVSSITFAGDALARLGARRVSANYSMEVWGLKNPQNNGTKAVVVTLDGGENTRMACITFDGVDQTTPIENDTTATGTDAAPTVSVTSATGDVAFGVVGYYANKVCTPDQTNDWNEGGVTTFFSGQHTAGANPVTLSWTLASAPVDWSVHAFSLNADAPIPGYMWL